MVGALQKQFGYDRLVVSAAVLPGSGDALHMLLHARHRTLQPGTRGIATGQGVGASLSGLVAGVVVDRFGYSITFLMLATVAAVAPIVYAIGMPETVSQEQRVLVTRKENG